MSYSPNIAGATTSSAPYSALPGLLPPNIGTAGGGAGQQNIIRTLFDYDPLVVLRDVHQRHVKVSDFRLILKSLGMGRGVHAPTTGHYEKDWQRGTVKIGSINTASTGAGTNVILVLHADSMFNAGATVGGAARQSSEVKVNDWILGVDGFIGHVIAKNETVSPHRITVRPLKAAQDLVNSFVANGEYAIVSNAWAEGTGLPLGAMTRLTKYTNTFQIIKQGAAVTGSELSNRLFVKFTPSPEGDTVFAEMNEKCWDLFERDFSHALLIGQQTDNLTDTVNISGLDAPIIGTEGLITWVEANGHIHIINTGAYTLADFDNIGRTLIHERAGTYEAMTLDGYDIFTLTENLLLSESGTDLTQYIMQKMGSRFESLGEGDLQPFQSSDFGLYVGFKALRKSGITYYFKQMQEFNDAKGLGLATYDYTTRRLVLPIGQVMDAKKGTKGFMWGYEWKDDGAGYSREMQYGTYGGVGTMGSMPGINNAVMAYDHVQWGMVAEVAGHFACPNKVIEQKEA